jgi:hypothetical protein
VTILDLALCPARGAHRKAEQAREDMVDTMTNYEALANAAQAVIDRRAEQPVDLASIWEAIEALEVALCETNQAPDGSYITLTQYGSNGLGGPCKWGEPERVRARFAGPAMPFKTDSHEFLVRMVWIEDRNIPGYLMRTTEAPGTLYLDSEVTEAIISSRAGLRLLHLLRHSPWTLRELVPPRGLDLGWVVQPTNPAV